MDWEDNVPRKSLSTTSCSGGNCDAGTGQDEGKNDPRDR